MVKHLVAGNNIKEVWPKRQPPKISLDQCYAINVVKPFVGHFDNIADINTKKKPIKVSRQEVSVDPCARAGFEHKLG